MTRDDSPPGAGPTLTPEEYAQLPLDATRYEKAVRATDRAGRPDSQGPTAPGIPRTTLMRRDTAQRRMFVRAELLFVHLVSTLDAPAPDDERKRTAIGAILQVLREARQQGRSEKGKDLAEANAESAEANAAALEHEAHALMQKKFRENAERENMRLRAQLVAVKNGDISPEDIGL